MICKKCGCGAVQIDNTAGIITCLREDCGNVQFDGGFAVDRDRLRRLALRKDALRDGKEVAE